jgi:two-component system, NtrC family, sensor kinase
MSLKWKVNLILIAGFAMLAATLYAVEQLIVRPSFIALEDAEARDDMSRCVDDIKREVEHLSILCGDWAAWNDAYAFAADKNQEFIKGNLVAESFKNNHLDFLAFLDTQNKPHWRPG